MSDELSEEEKELRKLTKQIRAHFKGMDRKTARKIALQRLSQERFFGDKDEPS